jgi:choline dehydrogenase/5-(hydroxymethyl)furfural/furfural oxidase
VNRAVATSAAASGLTVRPVRATATSTHRVTLADAYLVPARDRPNLTVRTDATVATLLLAGRTVYGVRLTTGEELEAPDVVVCAGAIHSPVLLLRSGIDRPGLGENLQDHPALRIVVPLVPDQQVPDHRRLPFGVTVRDGLVEVLPMDHTGDVATGGVLVALMDSHARGRVQLAGDEPAVAFDLLADERDREVLAAALARVALITEAAGLATEVPPIERLRDVFHAAGTCRMGEGGVVDERLRVVGYDGLRVADASVVPVLPRAHPMLTCALIGERLVELW